jgi:predicted transcriptional regulator
MVSANKRTTVYLDPDLHRALRLKAATMSRTVSELVNDAIKESLSEDAEDILAFEVREKEPLVSYEDLVKRLKKDGRI